MENILATGGTVMLHKRMCTILLMAHDLRSALRQMQVKAHA